MTVQFVNNDDEERKLIDKSDKNSKIDLETCHIDDHIVEAMSLTSYHLLAAAAALRAA